MTQNFTTETFTATDAPTPRSMPDRLNDIVNVKDHGATGDGITDDSAAITAAIDYAAKLWGDKATTNQVLTGGSQIYFPPGTYFIGTPPLFFGHDPAGLPAQNGAYFNFVGAGRNATILTGNFPGNGHQSSSFGSGFLVFMSGPTGQSVMGMTIRNTCILPNSGALNVGISGGAMMHFESCRFIGFMGVSYSQGSFGCSFRNCIFECSKPTTLASAATRFPKFDHANLAIPPATRSCHFSFGLNSNQAFLINCHAVGFDIGFSWNGMDTLIGCSAKRCGVGIAAGWADASTSGGEGGATEAQRGRTQDSHVLSCYIERCTWGYFDYNAGEAIFAANYMVGNRGPYNDAAILSITGSGTITVTTVDDHNLAASGKVVLLIDGTDQIVSYTKTGARTFTYSGASPGAFSSASWNYPIEYGITLLAASLCQFMANTLNAKASVASFDWLHAPLAFTEGSPNVSEKNRVLATTGPYGWSPHSSAVNVGWNFIQCGKPGSSPPDPTALGILFAELPRNAPNQELGPIETQTYTVVDAATQTNFAGIVTGGSGNHYKVRYDGANWRRVG